MSPDQKIVIILTAWTMVFLGVLYLRRARRRAFVTSNPPMIGAIFLMFRADGCMATDHRFQWMGVGDHFEPSAQEPGEPLIAIRVMKRDGNPTDWRDGAQGVEKYFASDKSIQEVAPGVYLVIR